MSKVYKLRPRHQAVAERIFSELSVDAAKVLSTPRIISLLLDIERGLKERGLSYRLRTSDELDALSEAEKAKMRAEREKVKRICDRLYADGKAPKGRALDEKLRHIIAEVEKE